jgi:hypothetical protein
MAASAALAVTDDNLRTPPFCRTSRTSAGPSAAYGSAPELVNCMFTRCWSDKQFDPNSGPDPNNIPDPNVGVPAT